MKKLYLVLAIIGAIVPYLFFIPFISAEGMDLSAFTAALFVNGAAGGLSADVLMSSLVFWIFMFHQLRKPSNPKPYLFIALNLLIGLSCALPAYLYAREHTVQTDDADT